MTVNLLAERLNRGLSSRAAAAIIGVTQDLLLKAEAGSQPHPKNMKKIADFYGVKVTDVWPVEPRDGVAA